MTKTDLIHLRIDPADKRKLKGEAAAAGLPLSEYIRQTALAGPLEDGSTPKNGANNDANTTP